jgi:hypothetical protein
MVASITELSLRWQLSKRLNPERNQVQLRANTGAIGHAGPGLDQQKNRQKAGAVCAACAALLRSPAFSCLLISPR